MNFVDEKFAAEKHSACAIARLTHSTKGAIDSNLCDVTQSHRPGPDPDPKLNTQNWIHKIGYTKLDIFGNAVEFEVVDAPFRANRRLMFVMRRFLYIALSIQMLLYCIIRFAVRYTFPYWASWMIWFGFGGQTIALIFLLAILPKIRV